MKFVLLILENSQIRGIEKFKIIKTSQILQKLLSYQHLAKIMLLR